MKKSRWLTWMPLLVSLGLILAACGAPPAPPPPTAAPQQMTAAPAQTQAQVTPTLPPAQPLPASGTTPVALAGTNWKLTTIEALGASAGTVPGTEITLSFGSDGQAGGSAGCNSYSGSYTVTGDTLTFGPLISTQMACPEPIMKQEQAYLAMLAAPATVKQEAERLTLTFDGGKTIYSYAKASAPATQPAAQPAAPAGLADTSWKLATVEAAGATNPPLPGTEITLDFSADGQVSGSAGCNNYNGSYKLEGNQLTIGPLATTRKNCEDPTMLQEQGYLTMLQTPATVDQTSDHLTLTMDSGKIIFTYTPAGAAPSTGGPSSTPAPDTASQSNLANTNWKLTSVDAFGTSNAPAGVEITLNFGADNTVNGSAGCNNYNGPYQLAGDQLTIGPLISTMKACSDIVMGQEAFYLTTLQKPAQVKQADNRLTLTFDGGKEVFNYTKVNTAAPAAGLPGTKWDLRYLVDAAKQSKSSLLANTQITLIFGTDGTLSGTDGCNQYNGTYQANGNQLTVGPLIATRMACSPEVMQQESTYLIALQSATSFEQSAQQLIITHPAGRLEYAAMP